MRLCLAGGAVCCSVFSSSILGGCGDELQLLASHFRGQRGRLEASWSLRLRQTDIPLSACDFHVSNVIEEGVLRRATDGERQVRGVCLA